MTSIIPFPYRSTQPPRQRRKRRAKHAKDTESTEEKEDENRSYITFLSLSSLFALFVSLVVQFPSRCRAADDPDEEPFGVRERFGVADAGGEGGGDAPGEGGAFRGREGRRAPQELARRRQFVGRQERDGRFLPRRGRLPTRRVPRRGDLPEVGALSHSRTTIVPPTMSPSRRARPSTIMLIRPTR